MTITSEREYQTLFDEYDLLCVRGDELSPRGRELNAALLVWEAAHVPKEEEETT